MIPAGLLCWEAMTPAQQRQVVITGTFAGYEPNPDPHACTKPAEVGVELGGDEAPGCRYYCLDHALHRLQTF